MIRIHRQAEPWRLIEARAKRLCEIRIRIETRPNEALEDRYLTGYREAVIHELHADQAGKCCYCERKIFKSKGTQIEHFRPKRGKAHYQNLGYWWLTWSWENLLCVCGSCNQLKLGRFPLRDSADQLAVDAQPPGEEAPLYIDPGSEDPLEHIEFSRVDSHWIPRHRTARGQRMITDLRLEEHTDDYTDWIDLTIAEKVSEIREHVESGDIEEARRLWQILCKVRLRAQEEYRALTWCYLKSQFSVAELVDYGFELVRPTSGPAEPIESFTRETQKTVGRLGARASLEQGQAAVRVLLAERKDLTARELEVLLNRGVSTIRKWS